MSCEPTPADLEEMLAAAEQRIADYWEGVGPDYEAAAEADHAERQARERIHVVGRWQHFLSVLRIRVPRALCGASLAAGPDEPGPGPGSPGCPACLDRWHSIRKALSR